MWGIAIRETDYLVLYKKGYNNNKLSMMDLKKVEDRAEYNASVISKLDEIGLDLDWNKM